MLLSKEELVFIIAIAALIPIILISFLAFLLYHQNNLRKKQQIEIFSAMMQTQERERERIAKDLHDHVGSLLSGIKLQISFNAQTLEEKKTRNIDKAKNDINKTIEEIRNIIHDLHSTDISYLGFTKTLLSSIDALKENGKEIKAEININEPELSYEFKSNLYKICLELLNNSIKYSGGSQINISILQSQKNIQLVFRDNGHTIRNENGKGYGLQNIQNRVRLLGGIINQFTEDFTNGAQYDFKFRL